MVELIAELSANHIGKLGRALALIEAAADAGADSVKFQAWTPGKMCLDLRYTLNSGPWVGQTLAELYEQAHTPIEWFPNLAAQCRSFGLPWVASVFDVEALEAMERLGCHRYKIASFELIDLDLISACAKTNKPLILSTGMADLAEISSAISHARRNGCNDLTILHCVSAYPSSAQEANLRVIETLQEQFRIPVGLSDHSKGHTAAVIAASLGVSMIEKHLTLLRSDGGPDSGFSMEPHEFADMVRAVRWAELAMGDEIGPLPAETPQLKLRRSLYVAKNVKAGEKVTHENVRTARPAEGLNPAWMPKLEGMRFKSDLPPGTPMSIKLVSAST